MWLQQRTEKNKRPHTIKKEEIFENTQGYKKGENLLDKSLLRKRCIGK